jgi:hypothetical protein
MKNTVVAAVAALAMLAGMAPSFAAGPQSGSESANIGAGGEAYPEGYIMYIVMCHMGEGKHMVCEMHEMTEKH